MSLHGPSCGQRSADEANEAMRASRTGKALTHGDSNSLMQTHRESPEHRAPDRQAVWGQTHTKLRGFMHLPSEQQQQQYLNRAPQPLSCEVRPQSLLIGHWSGLRLTSFGLG